MVEEKVREGYKRTEIGVIPEDWKMVHLGNVSFITKLAGFEYSKHFNSYKDKGEIVVIRGTNITNSKLDLKETKTISKEVSDKLPRSKLEKNDLVFAYVGTIGPVYIIEENSKYHLGPNTCKIRVDNTLYSGYLFQYFRSWLIKNEINELVSVGAQPSLSMTKIRKFKITTPPLKEQKAIAEVLTDTDDLITSLQELIEKKEKIKKGAMQKLLTGEERLPGFDEEWEETCLGDIGITYGGLRSKRKKDFVDGNKKYIPFLNIINNVRIDIDKLDNVVVNNNENQNKAEYGDMFFNTSSETPEEVGMCAVLDEYIEELYLNSFCFGYRIYNREKYSPILIAYYLRSDLGRSIFSTIAQGATRYNLSKKLFNKIKILLPGIKEQKAIAQILSDMDSEIEALNKKLNKYKEIKQGMMEELLTGRIRLV